VGLGAWCDESDVLAADGLAFDVDEFAGAQDGVNMRAAWLSASA
jgi:hypothetical protein